MTSRLSHPVLILAGLSASLLLLAGCRNIGPRTIPRDRFDYSSAISDSWKRHALLNIVKLRYFDPPISVDVGQIVAGYSLEADVSLGGTLERGGDSMAMGLGARYTDRPTITYTPLTGNQFVRSTLMPLPPDAVFFTVQSGWPADGVLFAAVASINGLKNQEGSLAGVAPPDPAFLRALELLRKIQQSGAVAVRIHQDQQKQQTTLLAFRSEAASPEIVADINELRQLLKLDPEAQEFRMVFAATASNNRELAVVTRSMIQIMGMMAAHVQVPEEDIAEGRATPGLGGAATLHIACSQRRPPDAFAAVPYRGRWFWIDDRDLKTKRAFALLMMLGTMADTGEHPPLPLITIPAQ
ncbi:MAG: hypothetical protein KA118_06670 [Verrucomicrobia bacterium]|nr:hypothetical protein [Verrucomicrobiota bacterium]